MSLLFRSQVPSCVEGYLLATAILAAELTFFCAPFASAQAVSNAKLHGVVTDSTGAVVPHALVTATLTESGQAITAVTSDDGDYVLPALPVGSYVIKVSAPGFQTTIQTGIILQVSNDLELDAHLSVGATDSVVNVEASSNQVQTEDNSINTVVDQARVVDLPLNGRNAANLILLSGGAAPAITGNVATSKSYGSVGTNSIGASVAVSVAGGVATQINFLMDGGDNNDSAYNTNLPFPFPDALQEFSVQTTGLGAQYGVHPAATVNIVTKGGTNQFHGGVFEFLRNNYANASNRITGNVDTLKRNQYGAFLGGPILPKKLFFFTGYQGTALRISQTSTAVIPTAAVLSGNWTPYFQAQRSASASGACPIGTVAAAAKLLAAGFTTADPVGCTATIAPSLYSPVSLNVEKLMPTSTTLDAVGNVQYAVPYPQNENQWIGRLDSPLSSRQSVFARYFMTNYSAQAQYGGNLLNTVNPQLVDRDKTLTLGDNFTVTPQLTNALRLTGTRLAVQRNSAPTVPNLASLGSNITNPEPNFLYLLVSGDFTVSCQSCSPYALDRNELQAADDVAYVKGKHFIEAGVDYIDQDFNGKYVTNENGQFTFSGSYTGFALADFLLGAPATLSQSNGGPAAVEHLRQNYFGYYAQDTYHLNKSTVLNFGLRWEPWLPAYDRDGRASTFSQANFNAGLSSTVFPNAPAGLLFVGDPGIAKSIITKKLKDVSPRIGFAVDPTGQGKQSIRGSYTLDFDEPSIVITSGSMFQSEQAPPFGESQNFAFNNATFKHNLDNPFQGIKGGNIFPTPFPPTANATFPSAGISPQEDPPGIRRAYIHEYNLSYQNQISSKWLLSVSYIGTHTVHLSGFLPVNYATYYPGISTGVAGSCGTLTPVPAAGTACSTTSNTTQRYKLYQQSRGTGAGTQYGAFSEILDYGMSNYNGLVLTANHQFANSYTILANYTYSKCLGNINYGGDNSPAAQNPGNLAGEYGPCNFDVRHNLTLSGVAVTPKLKNSIANALVGGFQVSPLFSYRTGLPFSVETGTDVSLTGIGQDRANLIPGAQVYMHNFYRGTKPNYIQWFNPQAFSSPALGTFGTQRPFSFRGPGFANLDLSISKFFSLHDRARLELRGEAFNALNHPNYATPSTTSAVIPQVAQLNSPNAGLITSTATDSRLLQIAGKITF